ncbi:ABC transporter permease [Microbacterium trichothecenolyticum]|uniref:Peptide/nickel transport system permease protein n=1 Tax=Microbacterium trichothecenolyticum TaxID=69370 RepID=A0ABU0TUW1_MICTR|nr:ABC transporter permease [Microbacterium trichothecenolyticum]MDQ1123445.1 peptide/nickel transport system permease protein [Microbacterium trichothecenolyticum]
MTVALAPHAATPRRFDRVPVGVIAAFVVIAALVAAAVAPGLLATQDPLASDPADAFAPPSAAHWLGTDQLGRDLYSRLVHGAWYSLSLGVGATVIALAGGVLLGVIAGYTRGITDRIVSRGLDVLLAFPEVLVALVAIAVLGPGQASVIWAVGLGRIPGAARLVRSQVLQVRQSGYVGSAVTLGLPPVRLVARHVVPNSLGPVLVSAVLGVGVSIIFGAALSFLGLGAVPPTPEWGLMLAESRQYLSIAPALSIWPGLFITASVVAITVAGRWAQQRFVSRRSSL